MNRKFVCSISFILLAVAGCTSSAKRADPSDASQAIELAKSCVQTESVDKLGSKIDLTAFRVSDAIRQKDKWKVSFKPLLMIVPINRATPSNAIVYVSEKPSCVSEWTYVDNRGPHDKFEYMALSETKSAEIVNFTRDERVARLAPLQKAIAKNPALNPIMSEIMSDNSEVTGSVLVLEREDYWLVHLFEIPRWDSKQTSELRSHWFKFNPKTEAITEIQQSLKPAASPSSGG